MSLGTLVVVDEIPGIYQSQVTLVISVRAAKDAETTNARISAAKQQAISALNLKPLIERYHLKGATESMDSAVQSLRKEIKIETKLTDSYPQFPETVTISYRHQDPKVAQQFLTDLVSIFDQTNEVLRRQAETEASWLDSQIAELEGQLAEPSMIAAVPGLDPISVANDPTVGRLALDSAIGALGDKEYALEQQIAEQKRQIDEQRKIVDSIRSIATPQDSAYGALLVRKAELNAQLVEYASQYTDKNAKVVQARTQLLEIDRQLSAREAKNQSGGIAATPALQELLTLERDLIRLQTELEITRRETGRKKAALGSLPQADVAISKPEALGSNLPKAEARARYDRLLKRYNFLTEQRDAFQKARAMEGRGQPLFEVIDPPNFPQNPVGPNRLMLRGLAMALALGVGLLVVPVVEGRRLLMIQDHRDVEYFLGVPVLGLIPETVTPVERRRRWPRALACRCGIVLLAAALPAGVLVLKHFGLLRIVVARALRSQG